MGSELYALTTIQTCSVELKQKRKMKPLIKSSTRSSATLPEELAAKLVRIVLGLLRQVHQPKNKISTNVSRLPDLL